MGSVAVKLLLDTLIRLWSLLDPARITHKVAAELEDLSNELWLSPISIWEFLIHVEKGRIVLKMEPREWIRDVFSKIAFNEAPINREVAIQSRFLQLPLKDPADRFLIATALVFDLTLVTADEGLIRSGSRILANN